MGKYSTLAYDSAHAKALQHLCDKLEIKQREFLESAINFFEVTGLDPRTPSVTFRSETNRLIGFIKKQDENAQGHFAQLIDRIDSQSEMNPDIMVKMLGAMNDMLSNQTAIMKHFQIEIARDSQQ